MERPESLFGVAMGQSEQVSARRTGDVLARMGHPLVITDWKAGGNLILYHYGLSPRGAS